jgi:hypothetical protein
MRTLLILALATLSVAACSIQTKTVERTPTPDGRPVTTSSTSIGTD